MWNRIQKLFLGKLARVGSWIFIGGVANGMLGYLFQIIMGRMLSVTEYGIFSALMAMMVVIVTPLSTLSMVISRQVSTYRALLNNNNLNHLFYWINHKLLLVAIALMAIVVLYIDYLQYFLMIKEYEHLYLLLAVVLIAFPQSVGNAYLQGLQNFKWLATSGVFTTVLKIIIATMLVYFGFGVSGVLGGVILSTFIIVVVTYIILRRSLKLKGDDLVNKKHLSLKSAMPVLLANTTFVIMTQIDMVVVNYYFSEQDVGLYAAASILGKAVMYLPGGIAMALFPMVAENQAHGKSSVNLIFQAVGITALLCMLGAVFYFLFSDFTITFLYGIEYKEAANILKYFGFAIFPMALIMVAEYFLIAMGRVLFAYLFMVVTPLQLVGFYYYHDTLLEIVTVLFISGMALAFSGYGILWRAFKVEKTATKI